MSVEVKGLSVNINAPQGIGASIKRFKKLDVNVGAVTITTPGYIPPTYEGETEVTPDKGTQTLKTDGYLVKDDITIHPIPDEYIVPEGTKNIVTNGTHDVKQYESAKVNVPIPEGYIKPQGTKQITQNGSHDVGAYKTAAVNVPIPDGYIKPSGTKQITSNGEHDVNSYQKVNVDIENEIPEGYYDASGIDTEPSKVLSGEEFINKSGKQVGSMPNNGAVNATIQGLVNGMSTPQPYTIPEGYHNGQGKVQISSDVKTLHDDIAKALRQKGQTVSPNYDPKAFPTLIGNIQTSEDLDSVLTEQEELIAELQDTLRGKAAGGGGTTPTQEKTVNITTNGTHTVTPDAGYALSKVTANVNVPLPEAEYIEVTPTKEFQHITPSAGKIIGSVGVNPIPDEYIVPDWEYKQVTPTKDFQHVVPSEGKVLGAVGVDPIPDEYIIPQGSKELTVNYDLYDVREFEAVYVNVPIPDGYIKPSGTKEITQNGTHDVTEFASVNVNVAGGGGGGNFDGIPDGWARAGYIYFSGKQTVDTNVICNKNTKIQLAFTRERSSQHYLYGVASSDNTASVTAYLGGSWRFGNKSITKSVTTNADMIYSVTVTASTITVTGSASSISGTSTFETVGSLLLGACRNSNGTVGASQFIGKVLFFSMWEGTEQVLHLTPVTDGTTYRFYDMVSKTFFDSITDTPLEGGYL